MKLKNFVPKAEVEKLKAEHEQGIRERTEELELLRKKLIEVEIEKSKGMGDKFKVAQLERQMSVINHITAGRVNEAIQEILTPTTMLFTMDVRFADDTARIASEDETMERLKKLIGEAVAGVKIHREPKAA